MLQKFYPGSKTLFFVRVIMYFRLLALGFQSAGTHSEPSNPNTLLSESLFNQFLHFSSNPQHILSLLLERVNKLAKLDDATILGRRERTSGDLNKSVPQNLNIVVALHHLTIDIIHTNICIATPTLLSSGWEQCSIQAKYFMTFTDNVLIGFGYC